MRDMGRKKLKTVQKKTGRGWKTAREHERKQDSRVREKSGVEGTQTL